MTKADKRRRKAVANIPRTVKPLLEEFDPAGRLLLFLWVARPMESPSPRSHLVWFQLSDLFMECRERNKAEQKVSCFVLPFDHEDDPPPSNSGRIRVRRRSLPPLIRSAGEPPAVLAAGSGPGEHGLAVFKVRFRGGVHIRPNLETTRAQIARIFTTNRSLPHKSPDATRSTLEKF